VDPADKQRDDEGREIRDDTSGTSHGTTRAGRVAAGEKMPSRNRVLPEVSDPNLLGNPL